MAVDELIDVVGRATVEAVSESPQKEFGVAGRAHCALVEAPETFTERESRERMRYSIHW